VRYVFSGGSAALIDILLLFILTYYFNVFYLSAATFALTISFIVRFMLQKFLTFQDEDRSNEKKQFAYYSILYVASLAFTNFLMYVFVEKFGYWYVGAQVLSIGIVACVSFLVYKYIIFVKPKNI
jgi:putative flippase GtrA